MTNSRLERDLSFLLHPCDDRDIPVPGFPSGDALIAWARTKPVQEMRDALITVLKSEPFPQQQAATAVLRSLGVEVDGEREGENIIWTVRGHDGNVERISPVHAKREPLRLPAISELRSISEELSHAVRELSQEAFSAFTAEHREKQPV